jgi:hypothetical protein
LEVLEVKYESVNGSVDKLVKFSEAVSISDEKTLEVAQNNYGLISDSLKSIESIRTMIKEPYLETCKLIDSHAKELATPLEKAKALINNAITGYKTIQAAAARAEAEKARQAAQEIIDAKAEEVDMIERIARQLVARLYGGSWTNKAGQTKSAAGCFSKDDCTALVKIIDEQVPKPDSFVYFKDEYMVKLSEIKLEISKYEVLLEDMNSDSDLLRENAQTAIDKMKLEAGVKINDSRDESMKEVIKEARADVKQAEKEVKAADKGIRKTLKFAVEDITKVPHEFLLIDETKVREWANDNKDVIKNRIKDNDPIINGIKFWLEEKYVS